MINRIILLFGIFLLNTNIAYSTNIERMGGTIEAEVDNKLIYLPKLKTDIVADIEGDIASIEIKQSFANPTNKPMNARYLFPMNKDSAVYQMTMVVGDEITHAIIKRKQEAIRTFEKAKREGRTASLLSQHRPNMFTQKLANLMPGEEVHIKIKYTQIVPRIDNNYELVVPLIVGPRYQPANANVQFTKQGNRDDIKNTQNRKSDSFGIWELQELPKYPAVNGLTLPDKIDEERVSIKVNVNSAIKIDHVFSDTHAISSSGNDHNKYVTLKKDRIIDNSDFVLKYQLSGDQTQAGFLSTEDTKGEGYFSLLIEPPAMPKEEQISNREMVFVLDTSGSMNGQPLAASKVFMRHALNNLRSGDHFRIISFNNVASEYSNSPQIATKENIEKGLKFVDNLTARGGTEIATSITQAFNVLPINGNVRMVTFLTDGYIGNEAQILNLISQNIGDARIFAFGVGSSVNRFLLSEMGRKGRGFARYIDPTENMNDAAISLAARLNAPVLTDISLDFGDMEVSGLTPDVIPDLFAGDSIRIQGKYKGKGNKVIRINGKSRGNAASLPIKINLDDGIEIKKDAIPIIWARSQVADKMRHITTPPALRLTNKTETQLKNEVVNLGLKHSLVTQWTSFVAVSSKIVNLEPEDNVETDVSLPMVKGVKETAYPKTNLASNVQHVRQSNGGKNITVVGSRLRGRTALDTKIPEQLLSSDALEQTPSLNLAAGNITASAPAMQFSGASAPEPGAIGGLAILALMASFFIRRRKS